MSFQSHNPATGELIGTYPEHDEAETNVRLQRAWEGWLRWSRTPLHERRAFLIRLADLLDGRAETYGRLITAEMGKPLPDAIAEIKKSALDARHLAEAGEAYLKPQPIPGLSAQITYESIGPIFSVQPWNLPFWQALRFFNTTALVGNTAIVKHAETVQGCAEALEAAVRDTGGPDGLYVNLAIQVEACAAVIADPRVRAATVTGSVRAGRAVAAEAGAVGKRVVLELGGSDPFIVLEDADLAKAVQMGVASRYLINNGQGCICAKRFLVAAPLLEVFTKAFVEQSKALLMGDPMQEGIKLGPLARPDLRRNVHRQVQDAVKAGARVLTGGEIPDGAGNFYPPTVLVDLPPEAAIAKEEFFGPVAVIYAFIRIETGPLEVVEKFQAITGIEERRYAPAEITASGMAAIAAKDAIAMSGVDPETLDQIIMAHNFGDVMKHSIQSDAVPSLASRVKHELGIKNPNCIPYDVLFGCPGWLQGVIQADAFFKAGIANKALVIGSETLSRVIDQYDRDSMIFSDGAGASIIEYRETGDHGTGIIGSSVQSHCMEEAYYINMGKSNFPASDPRIKYIKMKGRKVYEYAVKHVPLAMKECLDKSGVDITELKKIFIHQANEKMDDAIVKAMFRLYGIPAPADVMPMSIHWLGNSSVATIPTLLDLVLRGKQDGHKLHPGDVILFASVGAGMNINAVSYRV